MPDLRSLLSEIRTRTEAATPGPWKRGHDQNSGTYGVVAPASLVLFPGGGWATGQDAAFSAAAREDVPRLVSMLESVLDYLDKVDLADPHFEDGHTDGITVGLQMASQDIRRRLQDLSG